MKTLEIHFKNKKDPEKWEFMKNDKFFAVSAYSDMEDDEFHDAPEELSISGDK